MDAEQVVKYTRSHLPEEWKETENGFVTWELSGGEHPPLTWLQEFWSFLNSHFKELSPFTGLPLIPVNAVSNGQPGTLARIQRNTTLIFRETRQGALPDPIALLLNRVGGTVVETNVWLSHKDLDSYVLSPSPRHVLQVLINIQSLKVIEELQSAPEGALKELKNYLSHLDSLTDPERKLLSQLPLFQTMHGEFTAAEGKQAVQSDCLGLTIPADLPMPDSVVRCVSEADRRLLQLLEVRLLDTAQAAVLLVDRVERGACGRADAEKTMTWILAHGKILFYQNKNLKDRCRELPFIEINKELKQVCSLFDPRVNAFKVLFKDHFFPPATYTKTPQMLAGLLELGLICKEEDASPEHWLHAATLVAELTCSSPLEARKRAQVLIKVFDANDSLDNFTHDQIERLKLVKWVPSAKPESIKQEDSMESGFFCPEEMRHSMFEDIVGYVMPLEGKLSENISDKLGLKRKPPPEKVFENLLVLISKGQTLNNPDTNVDFKTKLRGVYRHMLKSIPDYTVIISRDTPWLWNHNRFVAPKELVLHYPGNLDLSSHIGKLPDEFLPYKSLFMEFGLREKLTDEEILQLLYDIQQTVNGRELAVATSSEVKVSIEILNWIFRENKAVPDDIPVPVSVEHEQYTFKPKAHTFYCDLSKNGLKELEQSYGELHLVHEDMPLNTAEGLKITFLSTHILCPMSVKFEQCGQSEPITTRIKTILREYDEEKDIFKEIIQNAEDAEAQECKFLLDYRVHRDDPERLIDPGMKLCQGPCVWAFNNRQFSQKDWESIVRVGSASKENKVEKIGKFGLGFNTVYHVTDIPSILSGSTLLILDPNVTHLKKQIEHKSNPGIKLDLSRKNLLQSFPDQFQPYEGIFNCSFSGQTQDYPGTLIKLPFRTKEESLLSEISSKVYSDSDIRAFQEYLTKDAQSHLIFLKNINKVSLHTVPRSASTPLKGTETKDIFKVCKQNVCSKNIAETSESTQCNAEGREKMNWSEVDIVKITCELSDETKQVQHWLLCSCFSNNMPSQVPTDKNNQAASLLPTGGVAVPLQFNPETKTYVAPQTKLAGQTFCFLPLSIDTGLPLHMNGNFAVTSNRKSLWESGVNHEWNKRVLQDPLVTAYITALLALKKMSQTDELRSYCYHTFWPDWGQVSETFRPLVDAFYSTIVQPDGSLELFRVGEEWCSWENAIFLHESIEQDPKICAMAMDVCQTFVKYRHVVALPGWIRNSFKQAGLGNVLQEKTWDWEQFYQEAVFSHLGQMNPECRDALILHAFDLNRKEINTLLGQYPCIPTSNGELQYIQNLVNPTDKVACLFEPEEGRLLVGTTNDFCSPKVILHLQMLGMANNTLSLKDISAKAETIANIWNNDQDKAYTHIKCLLELMSHHLNNGLSPEWEVLRAVQFLPAFKPGDAKMERGVMLQRPSDVFTDKCAPLVNMTHAVLDLSTLQIHPSDPVLQMLGVSESPGCEVVLAQLKEAHAHRESLDTSVLHQIANECYRFLNSCLGNSQSDRTDFVLENIKSFPFVFNGDRFVNVNCVAEAPQFEARPYLHELPLEFTHFRTLWGKAGVEKEFTVDQCLDVLQELHSKHRNKPLPESDLSVYLTILTKGLKVTENQTDELFLPNKNGILQPAKMLFYDDSPWMPLAEGVTLCHEDISRPMALHFGIKTTRHHTLTNCTHMPSFVFQFEQHEQLTVRIKKLISAYPAKKDILKELIQNADDAEATEIHFVWDKRQHGAEKTFGETWNKLQGPALCVFNNKVFSEADLAGIQDLGEGGKQNTSGKTGKFGLGFNSVYHLTDCPAFVTGDEKLCISDPNKLFIERTSDTPRPGIGYELNDEVKQMYLDVYNSFLPDRFSLREGTMFRLPLRTPSMADTSEISKTSVTESDMGELCSALSEDPEGLVLFLRNICKIQIHEIDKEGKQQLTFSIEKNTTCVKEKELFDKSKQHALLSEEPVHPQKVIYETFVKTSDETTTWIIAEHFGSFKDREDIQNLQTSSLAQAAIAACVSPKKSDFQGEVFSSLPLPGHTGLPVHVNANFEVDSSRRSLWREDGHSQKTHWNEHLKRTVIGPLYAILLDHLRHNLAGIKNVGTKIEQCLKENYMCFFPLVSEDTNNDWHEMKLEVYRSIKESGLHVIPVLQSSTTVSAEKPQREYSFGWCKITETDPTEAPYLAGGMVFYDNISGTGSITETTTVEFILEDLGMRLVPTAMRKVWHSFELAGIELSSVTPANVKTFLRAKPLNDPSQTNRQLPLPINETLIKDEKRCSKLLDFCLQDQKPVTEKEANPSLIHGLPLLLTKDRVLRVFDCKSPKFYSQYDDLFTDFGDNFIDHKTNTGHIPTLTKFGFVKGLTISESEKYLKPLIQSFLKDCVCTGKHHTTPQDKHKLQWLTSLWKFIINELKTSSTHKKMNKRPTETLATVRERFGECCILPVICPKNNEKYLYPMRDISSVIHKPSEEDLSSTLFKLGFMTLDNLFFSEINQELYFLTSELLNVTDSSSVLNQLYNINILEFRQLSPQETNELQLFLDSGLSRAKDRQDYERKFKSLPLFETVKGERVRIDVCEPVLVLSMNEMSRFPGLLTLPDTAAIFLKDSTNNVKLSETLGLQRPSDVDFLVEFILPVVHKLSERQILDCLGLLLTVQHHNNYSKYKNRLISTFKNVRLIRSSLGRLEKASYFFDDEVELFSVMVPKEKVVPESFWDEFCDKSKAKELLIELGMRHDVSADDLITFAQQVETGAKRNYQLQDLKKKSSCVFKEALKFVEENESKYKKLLQILANVRFIFAVNIKTELCSYQKPFANSSTVVPIRGALMEGGERHHDLVWTSMPIIGLPVNTTRKTLSALCEAGAFENPPSEKVIENMRNICQVPCRNEQKIRTRAHVFTQSYAFLQDQAFNVESLAGLPVVLVENNKKLVRAEYVVLNLKNDSDFRPYLYKIPEDLSKFMDFFRKIGVKDNPTAVQLCEVLAAVHRDTCDKQGLHPNQKNTVKRAVRQLFELLKQKPQYLDDVQTLYLPGQNGKLMKSSKLYYNDTHFMVSRLEPALPHKFVLLQHLCKYNLGRDIFEHHTLLKRLPEKLQPQMLSRITEEKVVETQIKLCERNCEFSKQFTDILPSTFFIHGLICLMRENSKGKLTQLKAMEMCNNTFSKIQIVCCESLQTQLWLNNQPLPNTVADTDIYVKQEHGFIFYLKHRDVTNVRAMHQICATLAKEINRLLDNTIGNTIVCSILITCKNLEEVRETLATNHIHDCVEAESSFDLTEWRDALDVDMSSNSQEHSSFREFFYIRDGEIRFQRTSGERFSTGHCSYNSRTFNVPRPNPEEAQRWCRQARCDFTAAQNDVKRGSTEWCLFKAHQCVEKALIAAAFRNNGKKPNCGSVSTMASTASGFSPHLRSLPQLVQELTAMGVDPEKTQYPDYHRFPNIPNGQFRAENERRALDKASEILALLEEFVDH